MKGTRILLDGVDPKGRQLEVIMGDTSKPGTIMQFSTTAMSNGRFTAVAANTGTDGKAALPMILLEDKEQGKTYDDAYVVGTRAKVYFLQPGDEANIRVGEVAGTGNSVTIADRLILDAEDGILVPDSGSPQQLFAVAQETVSQFAGSALIWCIKA